MASIVWDSPMMARVPQGARQEITKQALVAAVEKKARGEDPDAQGEAEARAEALLDRLDAAAAQGRTTGGDAQHFQRSVSETHRALQESGYDLQDLQSTILQLSPEQQREAAVETLMNGGRTRQEAERLLQVPGVLQARTSELGARAAVDKTLNAVAGDLANDGRTRAHLQNILGSSVAGLRGEDFEAGGLPASVKRNVLGELVRMDKGAGLAEAERAGKITPNDVSDAMLAVADAERAEKAARDNASPLPKTAKGADDYLRAWAAAEEAKDKPFDEMPTMREMKADISRWAKEAEAKAEAAQENEYAAYFPVHSSTEAPELDTPAPKWEQPPLRSIRPGDPRPR